MIMNDFAVVMLPVVPMRAEASDKAEMVNQMLFGDTCRVLTHEAKWSYVKCTDDGYEGWIDNKQLRWVDEATYAEVNDWELVTDTPLEIVMVNRTPMRIPMGSRLPNEGEVKVGELTLNHFYDELDEPLEIQDIAILFHGAPYLWGGKTVFGVDCSGFVQTVLKVYGITMPRDASQQAYVGEEIKRFEDLEVDDLCFFENEAGRIVHVGIYMGNGEIIHASGCVRIDQLTESGIVNRETHEQTHKLCMMRRIGAVE